MTSNQLVYLTNTYHKFVNEFELDSELYGLAIKVKLIIVYNVNCFFVLSHNCRLFNTEARTIEFFFNKKQDIDLSKLLEDFHLGINSFNNIPKELILYPKQTVNKKIMIKLNLEALDFDSLLRNDYHRDLKVQDCIILTENLKISFDDKVRNNDERINSLSNSINNINKLSTSINYIEAENKSIIEKNNNFSELLQKLSQDLSNLTLKQIENSQSNIKLMEQLKDLELKLQNTESENKKLKEKIETLESNMVTKPEINKIAPIENRLEAVISSITYLTDRVEFLTQEHVDFNSIKSNYESLQLKMRQFFSSNEILRSHGGNHQVDNQISESKPNLFQNHQIHIDEPKDKFISNNDHGDLGVVSKSFYSKIEDNKNHNLEENEELMMSTSVICDPNQVPSLINKISNMEGDVNPYNNLSFQYDNDFQYSINVMTCINDSTIAIGRKDGKITTCSHKEIILDNEEGFSDKHNAEVTCLLFDTTLVSGSADETIKIWDLQNRSSTITIKLSGSITTIQYLFGPYFCCGTSNNQIIIFDSKTGKVTRTINCKSYVKAILYMDCCLVVASDFIRLWRIEDINTINEVSTVYGINSYCSFIKVSYNTFLAGTSRGMTEKWVINEDLEMTKDEELLTNSGFEVTQIIRLSNDVVACCSTNDFATIIKESRMVSEGSFNDVQWFKGIGPTSSGFFGVINHMTIKHWYFN